jgi:alanyl-tRNA synthetase
MDESTQKMIDKVQDQILKLEDQITTKKKLVNQLCEVDGEAPLYPDTDSASSVISATIRPDHFFGRPLATVVKEILEARKTRNQGAISLNDLFEILKSGGFQFDTKDEIGAKRGVAITIAKNPAFMKVPNNGYIGLAEWYPNVKKKPAAQTIADDDDGDPSEIGSAQVEENRSKREAALAAQEAAEKGE